VVSRRNLSEIIFASVNCIDQVEGLSKPTKPWSASFVMKKVIYSVHAIY
jgi:hypothetical protein